MDAILSEQLGSFGTGRSINGCHKAVRLALSISTRGCSVVKLSDVSRKVAELMGNDKYASLSYMRFYELFTPYNYLSVGRGLQINRRYWDDKKKKWLPIAGMWDRVGTIPGRPMFLLNPFVLAVFGRIANYIDDKIHPQYQTTTYTVKRPRTDLTGLSIEEVREVLDNEMEDFVRLSEHSDKMFKPVGKYIHKWLEQMSKESRQVTFKELAQFEEQVKVRIDLSKIKVEQELKIGSFRDKK